MSMSANAEHIYNLTIGSMAAGLGNMSRIMDKAQAHAAANDISLETLLQARLYPDMFSLLQQLQYVCYLSADFARHFSDKPGPRVGYDETTWAELRQSLSVAEDYLRAIAPEKLAQKTDVVVATFMDDTRGMTVVNYAAGVIMPDFNFHLVVAYALLRHNGVNLGKSDFLGELQTVAMAKP